MQGSQMVLTNGSEAPCGCAIGDDTGAEAYLVSVSGGVIADWISYDVELQTLTMADATQVNGVFYVRTACCQAFGPGA